MQRCIIALALGADVADGVSQGVTAQVAVAPEDFAARRALVRLQVGVRQQVRLEVGALVETAGAHRALVRRFLQVQDSVDGQRSRLAEPFAAVTAFERLFFRMDVTMITEMILTAESLAADIARIGPLIGVRPFVNEQIVRFGELAVAELANELLLGPGSPTGRRAGGRYSGHRPA